MRVQFKTLRAGPGGVVSPGQVVDLPDEEAQEAIRSGSAVEVAAIASPENAALRIGPPAFKHTGGGWYEFPDGTRIKGKVAAEDIAAARADDEVEAGEDTPEEGEEEASEDLSEDEARRAAGE